MIVITGGRVVDADGRREGDVAVDGDRIVAVGDVDGVAADAESVATVDASGKVVAPGLVDAHVHLQMTGGPDPSATAGDSLPTHAYRAAGNLRATVEAGVTTVRDLGGVGTLALDAARAVEAGTLVGPRVLAAGQNVVMTGGHGHWFGREADGPTEVRRAVREQLKRGADVIKCMATGGVLTPGARIGAPELTPDELAALVDAAGAKGVPTAAHAHGDGGIRNAVEAGITSVEHGTFMSAETAAAMADVGTYWVPTASALHRIAERGVDAGIPAETVEKNAAAGAAHRRAFEHAADAGVTVAMGTDAGTPFNFHGENATELGYLVDAGLSREAAVEAATVNAAALCGLDDVGLVREGYCADLVVLDGDPLADVSAYASPEHVFARGAQVV